MREILENFTKLRTKQVEYAAAYEAKQSYEMAYIALWSVLEAALKDITPKAKQMSLLQKIHEWRLYLEAGGNSKPREIKSFQCTRSETIPHISLIEVLLGNCPTIKEILNTESKNGSTKWRDKRNNIAHNAEAFKQLKTYKEYKNKLLAGLDEFAGRLSDVSKEN